MHKDALADGAEKALNEIFGPLPTTQDQDTKDNGNDNASHERERIYLGVMIGLVCTSVLGLVLVILWMKFENREKIESRLLDPAKSSLSSDHPPRDSMRQL
jgi:hypothetical protein